MTRPAPPYVHTYMYMYTMNDIYVYIHIYTIYIHIYVHACVHTYVTTYMNVFLFPCSLFSLVPSFCAPSPFFFLSLFLSLLSPICLQLRSAGPLTSEFTLSHKSQRRHTYVGVCRRQDVSRPSFSRRRDPHPAVGRHLAYAGLPEHTVLPPDNRDKEKERENVTDLVEGLRIINMFM